MSLNELQQILQAGKIPGLILLYGQESFFVDRGVQAVRDAVVEPANRDFNLTQFHGKDFVPGEVIEQARTYPVLRMPAAMALMERSSGSRARSRSSSPSFSSR